jgi:hypothetical protein
MTKNKEIADSFTLYDKFEAVNTHGLNIELAISNNLTLDDFASLQDLYEVADNYIEQLESEINIKETLDKLTDTEYLIQEGWGFDKNPDYHYFSFKAKNCTCPKLDNMDMIGSKYRVYSSICPIHLMKMIGD